MLVPSHPSKAPARGRRPANPLWLAVLFLLVTTPLIARNPPPTARIELESLGFQPLIPQYLLAGSSLLTLDYVDNTHLLLTFSARRLLKRIPGDPPTDQDRTVDALLLEAPSGKLLARTEWRLHDHGQYLWSLGHGQFMLRIRDLLTTFAPLDHLDQDPFAQRPFLKTSRRIAAIQLSPLDDLLTLETTDPPPAVLDPVLDPDPNLSNPALAHDHVQINFFRLLPPGPGRDYVVPRVAGTALSRHIVALPLNAAGYLDVLDQGRQSWAFDFDSYAGKTLQLGVFGSTCRPYPSFVSASEFIAFSCHGGTTRQELSAFNLRGDQMWEQTMSGSFLSPSFVYAPASGRFALERLIVSSAAIETDSITQAEITAQTVDVFQTDSGKMLLHVECSPTARAGQNFSLSPDGLSFAVVHDGGIEIYRLPDLTTKDQAAIKRSSASAPEPNEAPVRFISAASPTPSQTDSSTTPPPPPTAPAPETTPAASTTATSNASQPEPTTAQPAMSPTADEPRKPPTLYEPGESRSQ